MPYQGQLIKQTKILPKGEIIQCVFESNVSSLGLSQSIFVIAKRLPASPLNHECAMI